MLINELFGIFLKSIFFILEPFTYDLVLSPRRDSRVVSAQHLGDLQLIVPVEFVCELAICFPFTTKIMLNMLCYMHFSTVNSLVIDYPWFMTKSSLIGGFPFTTKIMLNMLCYMHFSTVNSLVIDYHGSRQSRRL